MNDIYTQSRFLIMKAAYLYYIKDIAQNEISTLLDVSIPTVSRLLKKSKDEKIIDFVIRDPYVKCIHLEEELKDAFGLKEAIIAPTVTETSLSGETVPPETVKKLVALEAARYLQRTIRKNDVLGVSWGSTIYHMINYLNALQKVDAKFVTLHGSIAFCADELDVRTLVSRMAKAFSGVHYFLLTDALASSKRLADMIKQELRIKAVFEMFRDVNISIVGMGSFFPTPTSILASPAYLSPEELQWVKKEKCVGDILLRFFSECGCECATELADRTIAISMDQYKKIDTKIALVSGEEKLHPVYEALRGKLINVLIIDYKLAAMLMTHNDGRKNLKQGKTITA